MKIRHAALVAIAFFVLPATATLSGNPTGAKEVYLYTGDTFATVKTNSDPGWAVRTATLNP